MGELLWHSQNFEVSAHLKLKFGTLFQFFDQMENFLALVNFYTDFKLFRNELINYVRFDQSREEK